MGKVIGENPETLAINVPLQKEALLKEVTLDALPEELSYIKRIVIAQSDEIASTTRLLCNLRILSILYAMEQNLLRNPVARITYSTRSVPKNYPH